ncbi:MAG: hypothetical protein R3351_08965, partial [Nitrospirales bacterium]|nr:hypothetical protein [Nitrospirales bacterium]
MHTRNFVNKNREHTAGNFGKMILVLGGFMLGLAGQTALAEDSGEIPKGMAYIPFGASIIGIDKDPSRSSLSEGETKSMYQRRMNMPWSREAFHDEGPAHWVVTDGYFID